jgi:hypothetical protein
MMTRRERLLSSLSFYGAYHNHAGNKLVHIVFVPCIWWSAAVFGCATGALEKSVGCEVAQRCIAPRAAAHLTHERAAATTRADARRVACLTQAGAATRAARARRNSVVAFVLCSVRVP